MPNQIRHSSVLIIGSGPAGYTAAIYAARALLKPILITGLQPGGQLTITEDIENYPGFAKAVGGTELMETMAAQAEAVGAEIVFDTIIKAHLSPRAEKGKGDSEGTPSPHQKPPFRLESDSGVVYTGDSIIIATGAQARWLGLPSEKKFMGGGVSACATCDGFFYRGQDVAVIGGGNSAAEEALYLSKLARNVTLIHRRDSLKAEKILQQRLFARDNIRVLWDSAAEEILGEEKGGDGNTAAGTVTGLRLKNTKTGALSEIAVAGVFIAIGHEPATALFKGQLRRKKGGYLWTKADSTATSVKGVFAAGDVADSVYRQAVTAAGRGCMAALEAERFLAERF